MICSGYLKFSWSYTTTDGSPIYDYPRYSVNGGAAQVLPGFKNAFGNDVAQSGSFSLPVNAGDLVQIQMYTSDNFGGAGSLNITNFRAPYQSTTTQSVAWYTTPTGGASLSAANPYSYVPVAGNYTYYAQVTNTATGCTNATRVATNNVTINSLPSVSTSATATTICEGQSTTITASGATTYSWQPGGATGSSITVSPTTTTTYTVTGTNANGCIATAIRTITVNPKPAMTGNATPGIVCPGGAVTFTGSGAGVIWNWQPGNLIGSPVVVNPLVQTTYTATATSSLGCTNTASFVILMNPVPNPTIAISPAATVCSGTTVTLTASGGGTYVWAPGGATSAAINVNTTGVYTVTVTNASGCTATSTASITVNPLPSVSTTATLTTICNGGSTTLTGTGASTYTWQPGNLSGTSVVVSPTSTTTYTVTGTSASGCTATATRLITVNTLPTITTSITNATICVGQSTTISASGASTYSWQPGALSGTPVIVSPASTTTYTVTGTAANGCVASVTRLVTVNTLPSVGTTTSAATLCVGQSTTINGTGASTYTWQPGNLSGASINVTPATTTTYTVTGTNASGCTATATRLITVNNLPTVSTSATLTTINCSGSTTITASGATSYTWQPGGASGSSITVSPTSTTTYTVTGTNGAGCTATATRTITYVPCASAVLTVKAFIEGYYLGASLMQPVLNNQGEPNPLTHTDTVTVELHSGIAPYALVHSVKAVLQTNGNAVCNFPPSIVGNSYYIVLKHRNALETWSSAPVVAAASYNYNFSNAITKAYGSNMSPLGAGVFGLFSGDLNNDMTIDVFDYLVLDPDVVNGSSGYLNTDVNGDGSVDVFDYLAIDPNIVNGVSAATP